MNEVTKIHLGRQAFTIAVDAQRELRDYIDAIKRRVHDDDVVNEVELRMAELLAERGVLGDKVILPADVTFLKEQLGDPKDFADDEPDTEEEQPATGTKRLFRDTDDALLAGVASGLANYFGIDVLLIRLVFIIGTVTAGWGVLLYILLWLLVPEAKTPSDRLQMTGKPVTVDNLKAIVERADVKGAAQRANNSLSGPLNAIFEYVTKSLGVCLLVIGLAVMLSIAASAVYVFLHSGPFVQGGVFPVGLEEHLVIYVAASIAGIISLFVVIFGMAVFWRKWPIRGWLTGTLIGLLIIGIAAGGALAADVAPRVRDRYNANIHTATYSVKPFTKVNLDNAAGEVRYQWSPKYSVSVRYYGHPDISTVKADVSGGVLSIDTRRLDSTQNDSCQDTCIPIDYGPYIIISSPEAPTAMYPGVPDAPALPTPKPPSGLLQN